jgi:hypothetical protein
VIELEETMTKDWNNMDCAQFEEIIHELDRPETRGPELREAALIHAESCGRCAVLLTEAESLDFALVRIAGEADRSTAPARLEGTLLQEFRGAKAQTSRRRVERQVAAIGIAAALFLALGISLRHRTTLPAGGEQSAVNIYAPRAGGAAAETPANVQATNAAPSGTEATADDSDGTELAQDFTPLPYADDPSMIEGGAVVRVVLSRTALASLGVSTDDIENSEQIPADIVVSPDGTPEAIRVVSQNVE